MVDSWAKFMKIMVIRYCQQLQYLVYKTVRRLREITEPFASYWGHVGNNKKKAKNGDHCKTDDFISLMHACSNPNDAAVCRIDWRRMSTYSCDFTFVSFSLLVVVVFFGIGAF